MLDKSDLQTTNALHASDYCFVLNPLLVCTSYHYCFGRLTILGCCST